MVGNDKNRAFAIFLREFRERWKLNTDELAYHTGSPSRTVEGWMQGRPCRYEQLVYRELLRLNREWELGVSKPYPKFNLDTHTGL